MVDRQKRLTHDGLTFTMSEWGDLLGISRSSLNKRIRKWGVVRALTTEKRELELHGDLSGRRFGRLTVIRRDGHVAGHHPAFLCLCDCGEKHRTSCYGLVSGKTSSCGCAREGHRRG